MLKAFRLNAYEAWAGKDLDDAIENAMQSKGVSREDAFDDVYGAELPMDMDIDVDDGGVTNVISILAGMQKRNRPGLVCQFEAP